MMKLNRPVRNDSDLTRELLKSLLMVALLQVNLFTWGTFWVLGIIFPYP